MKVQLLDCERVLMEEIATAAITRDSLSITYAFGLLSDESIDWKKVNHAIVERWSFSALEYIKCKAWRMVNEKLAQRATHAIERGIRQAKES